MPASTPADGSAGVVGTLWITVRSRSVSDRTRSVKVPPTSTPISFMSMPPWAGLVKRASGGVAFAPLG
jgi:hypothetical protein